MQTGEKQTCNISGEGPERYPMKLPSQSYITKLAKNSGVPGRISIVNIEESDQNHYSGHSIYYWKVTLADGQILELSQHERTYMTSDQFVPVSEPFEQEWYDATEYYIKAIGREGAIRGNGLINAWMRQYPAETEGLNTTHRPVEQVNALCATIARDHFRENGTIRQLVEMLQAEQDQYPHRQIDDALTLLQRHAADHLVDTKLIPNPIMRNVRLYRTMVELGLKEPVTRDRDFIAENPLTWGPTDVLWVINAPARNRYSSMHSNSQPYLGFMERGVKCAIFDECARMLEEGEFEGIDPEFLGKFIEEVMFMLVAQSDEKLEVPKAKERLKIAAAKHGLIHLSEGDRGYMVDEAGEMIHSGRNHESLYSNEEPLTPRGEALELAGRNNWKCVNGGAGLFWMDDHALAGTRHHPLNRKVRKIARG